MPETKARENNNIAIVDFLDLDTSKITFLKPKQNKHNGSQIGIRYNGKTLYVKYEGVTPFGIQENYDKEGNFMELPCKLIVQMIIPKKPRNWMNFL